MTVAAWRMLGIAPTDDAAAIRRAYAAMLKAFDVDAEPRRFAELRDAYDAARAAASASPAATTRIAPPDGAPPSATPLGRADRAAIARDMHRIAAMLADGRPGERCDAALADLTLRLLAEVDRDTLDQQADAETWLVETIVGNLPRSEAMVLPAVAAFRWHLRGHGQHRPDRAMIVVDRMRELNFAAFHVRDPGGRHHLAWRTLQQPPDARRRPDLAALAALEPFFREAGDLPRVAGIAFDPGTVARWHAALRRHDLAIDRWRRRRQTGWTRTVVVAAKWLCATVALAAVAVVVLVR